MLLLTGPLRSGWARAAESGAGTFRGELPAVLSLALVTALGAFFLLYTSVFTRAAAATALTRIPEGMPGHEQAEAPVAAGLAGYLVTTLVLVAPLLLAQRLGRRPRGTGTVVVAVVAWLSAAVAGTTDALITAAAVTLAAVVVDVVVGRVDRSGLPVAVRLSLSAAVLPALVWPAQLIAVAVTDGVRWPVELWSGVVLLSALAAAALGAVVSWTPGACPAERVAAPGPATGPAAGSTAGSSPGNTRR